MNQQSNLEPNNQQPLIEDLALNPDRAEELKGGMEYQLENAFLSGYQTGTGK